LWNCDSYYDGNYNDNYQRDVFEMQMYITRNYRIMEKTNIVSKCCQDFLKIVLPARRMK
jgi:hypothetical protein